MIGYHPARDPYHTLLRFVRLLDLFGRSVELERLRIADFILLFPEHIHDMSLPKHDLPLRAKISKALNPYWRNMDAALLFRQMRSVHNAALNSLLVSGMAERADNNMIKLNPSTLPAELTTAAKIASLLTPEVGALVRGPLATLPLLGNKGLKARSALMDYRYDAA